jgi:hypothetical protein
MATFAENITIIADKLTEINGSLQTIAGAVQGGNITIDLSGVEQAIQDLQFNDLTVRFGNLEFLLSSKNSGVRTR